MSDLQKSKLPADYKKHAITFLSFDGKEKLSTQENLFEVVQGFGRRVVVDNHIDWHALSSKPKNSKIAFILGTTVDKESSPLRLLLEDVDGNSKIRPNVFMFGMKSPSVEDEFFGFSIPHLVISRLDSHATVLRDMDRLRRFEQKCGDKASWDTSKSLAEEKRRVLQLLGINQITDVHLMPERDSKRDEVKHLIERDRPKCFKRFWESNDVARYAHAVLLLGSKDVSKKGSE